MRLGANGYPFGWDKERFDRWMKIKNDPDQSKAWGRLFRHWKRGLGEGSIPAFIVEQLTSAWDDTDTGSPMWFCGSKLWNAIKISDDTLAMNFLYSIDTIADLTDIRAFMIEGNKIKDTNGREYILTNVEQKIVRESKTTNSGNYVLFDDSLDMNTLGLIVGTDLLINSANNQTAILREIIAPGYIGHSEPYNAFWRDCPYKIVRVTFQLKGSEDGAAIPAPSSMQFHPANQIFYSPPACKRDPGLDDLRDNFLASATEYLIYYDEMTLEDKMIVNDVFKNLTKRALYGPSPSQVVSSDYDNWHYMWAAITLFLVTIKEDFPEIYQKFSKDPIYLSMKADITHKWETLVGGDDPDTIAMFCQGTNYSPTTEVEFIRYVKYIEWFTGEDHFPVITRKLKKLAEGLKVYYTPDLKFYFQWGDNNPTYTPTGASQFDHFAVFGDLTKDPELWYMWDVLFGRLGPGKAYSFNSFHSQFQDPYAVRATKEEWLSKKNKHYFDNTRGVSFFWTGRDEDAVGIYINDWRTTLCDHNLTGFDFGIFSGGFALYSPPGYASTNHHLVMGNFIPFGVFGLECAPTRIDYKTWPNAVFSKAAKSSANARIVHNNDSNISDGINGGAGNILDYSREIAAYVMKDGSVIAVQRDYLHTPSGKEGVATRTVGITGESFDDVPNNIQGVEGFRSPNLLTQMHAYGYRHSFQFPCPDDAPLLWVDEAGTIKKISWMTNTLGGWDKEKYTPGNKKVTLSTFVKNPRVGIYNIEQYAGKTDTYPCMPNNAKNPTYGGLGNWIKIDPPDSEVFGKNAWLHAIYVRNADASEVTYEEISDGLIVRGVEEVKFEFGDDFKLTVDGIVREPDFRMPPVPMPAEPPPAPTPTPSPTQPPPIQETKPMPENIVKIADEGETFYVAGTKEVFYGTPEKSTSKTFTSTNVLCDNGVFGDPAFGVKKACYIKAEVVPVPDPLPDPTPVPSPEPLIIIVPPGKTLEIRIK